MGVSSNIKRISTQKNYLKKGITKEVSRMAIEAIFGIPFIVLFFSSSQATTFTITNNCPYTIWPANLAGSGPQLSSTGFELGSKASLTLTALPPWSGRFWARTGCTTDASGKFNCATANCGTGQVQCNGVAGSPPTSLVEFSIAPNNGRDFYDVSLVDGFNLPISVTPQGLVPVISPRGGSGDTCIPASCARNMNSDCPNDLAVKGPDGNSVIGCKSARVAFNRPEYCCTENFNTSTTCKPTNYSMFFKNGCPQAYSYACDDLTSTFSCIGGANYDITFCP
ncbi:thaumatin-like protein 1 [Jatropha curcas]|uniref:thaumatin-like protein 1 n=1 Tax=Jatropha curcas TaxID=180498 RepID=UPI0018943F0B|nr:thaumatin-like protein 1 [Jatropha curcas]